MKIFVGCSCALDVDKIYLDETKKLAELLCKYDHTLVFGSSSNGMMGVLYNTFKDNDKKIVSIFPKNHSGVLCKLDFGEYIEVDNPTDQIKELVNYGDMTIILPGSFGTNAELASAIQCRKLGENKKEVIIYNINHYFDELLLAFNKPFKERFDDCDPNTLFKVVNSVDEIEKYLI